jgi:hypothetical protein
MKMPQVDPPALVRLSEGLGPNAQRESVDDALVVVESYGPWGADLNDAHRRQIVLADEVHRLRHLYEMAVRGRAEMRTALRQERDQLEARYMALLKAVADGRAMQPAPPILVDLGPNFHLHRAAAARVETKE